jgi:hypothetical protein
MVCEGVRVRLGGAIPRCLGSFARGAGAVVLALAFGTAAAAAQTYDLVLQGGRVMDPESGKIGRASCRERVWLKV